MKNRIGIVKSEIKATSESIKRTISFLNRAREAGDVNMCCFYVGKAVAEIGSFNILGVNSVSYVSKGMGGYLYIDKACIGDTTIIKDGILDCTALDDTIKNFYVVKETKFDDI